LASEDGASAKRPGVLVCQEWVGQNPYVRKRAEQLAELGYVAFALDMYGKGVQAKSRHDAVAKSSVFKKDRALMRARAGAGLEVLRKHPRVDAKRLAAIGYCFGGTCALELARGGADPARVRRLPRHLPTPAPAH